MEGGGLEPPFHSSGHEGKANDSGAEPVTDLFNIQLRHSQLSDKIYLCRFGKDPHLALDKREAEHDVMAVLVEHMLWQAPEGSVKTFTLGEQKYELRLVPVQEQVEETSK